MSEEKSFEEKLDEATNLAFFIAYENTRNGNFHKVREIPIQLEAGLYDVVWNFVDGLYQQWVKKRINGECSLNDSLNFNMVEEEKFIDSIIEKFKAVYNQLEPVYEIE